MNIISGIFLILHGFVHLLYFGQSIRLFELQKGMTWPDGSWILARLLENNATRILASIACILAAFGFVVSGIAMCTSQGWYLPVAVCSAVFSTMIFILLWDGQLQALHDKGLIAILINLGIIVALLIFEWPSFGF